MMRLRGILTLSLLCFWLGVGPAPGLAQPQPQPQTAADDDNVELIMTPPGGRPSRVRDFFQAFKQRVHSATGLPMTRCEKWTVKRKHLAAVKKAAASRGVVVTELGAGWQNIMRAAPAETKLSERQAAMMERAKAFRATTGVKVLVGPPPAILEHALTRDAKGPAAGKDPVRITVALGEGVTRTITRTSIELKPDMCIWRGTTEETGAQVTLMWWPNGRMAGTVQDGEKLYSIRHMGGPLYTLVEMSSARMPSEHAPMPVHLRSNDPSLRDDPLVQQGDASALRSLTAGMRPAAPRAPDAAKKAPAPEAPKPAQAQPGDIVIDVLIAYTAKAAANYSDIRRELVDLAIEEANESYRASGLGHVKLRLVHAYETGYVEEGAHFDHVWRFADKGDGYMEEVHGLRDKHRADVAVLIVDDPQGCGLATRVYADPSEAFAVVHHDCAAMSYTVAHEIGHLIGARHEPAMDKSTTPFPYGHGYVNGTKWRDIMSYKESCNGCPRLPVWSSPKVLVKGEPAGTPQQDNARVIAEQAARVAAFR